ncbi:late competence development ComFB family protein [Alkalimarinus sediminis]|uniref:Late competence development ComFB family protein n=1 Tax=Alkalimarinus sediminis TaxID=1632866 RepID=A0A9E8HQ65_9ALTE|nr:late competence development ComFB family protein [Alkalimarinus sediminis]UZW76698.1 late competence development ComFB family protein [Alkalimarinus sediminis]
MSIMDSIQNYYEPLVIETLAELTRDKAFSDDLLIDVMCVALNHLPPRYIRHEVDMIYYLSPIEAKEMQDKVKKAVEGALAYVNERARE